MQINYSSADNVTRQLVMDTAVILTEQGICVVIYGVQIHYANVWEAIFAHVYKEQAACDFRPLSSIFGSTYGT